MAKELVSPTAKELNQRIQERYDIGRANVYKRLNHLGIQPTKQGSETWLETEQLEALDKLNQYLLEGGKLEEYSPHSNGIVKAEPSEIESYQSIPVETIPVETIQARQVASSEIAAENLDQNAQVKATGKMILENILVQKYLDNPDLLPPELREAVAKSEALATPKPVDPWKYAQEAFRLMSAST
jgi:hypothetical protein